MTVHESQKGGGTMFRLTLRALGLLALLALAATGAWAGSDERKGTSGAPELLIQVGPRSSALGGAASSDVAGVESIFWNPAGLANMEGPEALFSHMQYFAGMNVNFAAVATRAGTLGSLGFSAKVLSVGDVIVTTEAAPDGTGEVITPTFTVLTGSWARQFTDRVNFGASLNLVNESILDMRASGLAFDFGVQYTTGWNGLVLAMTMKNFGGSMKYTGSNLDVNVQPPGSPPDGTNRTLSFSSAAFEMPSYFTLSGGYDMFRQGENALRLRGAFQNNNFFGDNFTGALEWGYKDMYAIRGSWFGTLTTSTDPTTRNDSMSFDSGDDLYQGFALGGTLMAKTGTTRLGVDLAWRPAREFFDDIVEVGLRVRF
jgi:hypothetical protein